MRITVIGTGYVGLVSGACLADRGHEVVCLDVDAEKIARLLRGEVPIHEPGLGEVIARAKEAGRLRFTTSYAEAIPGSVLVLLAVGTPSAPDGSADLRYVFAAVDAAIAHADRPCVFVTKSTVPVGTAKQIEARLAHAAHAHTVASNPEMLRESRAVEDFFTPSRIIFGVRDAHTAAMLEQLYAAWDCPKIVMSPESAELTKYANNTFLAVKISFINEVAQLARAVGANIEDVADGIGSDPRIGRAFLHAGLGWGGSCFPKDVSAYQVMARAAGVPSRIADAAVHANTSMRTHVMDALMNELGSLSGKTIGLLGLAFKGGTDDTRASGAIAIASACAEAGASVCAYDARAVLHDATTATCFTRVDSPFACISGVDAVVVATEWDEFRQLDLAEMKRTMRGDVLIDARNLFDPQTARAAGFRYWSVGRP